MAETNNHPYVPRDLYLPGYVPNILSASEIVAVYLLASTFVVSVVWIVSGRVKNLSKFERLLMCWWAFTGLTHLILEGYFAYSPELIKDTTGNYLAEVWKEYSKGDSRYAGRDPAIVAVEAITATLEGPASLLAVHAIATKQSYSEVLQLSISLGQLYGTFVYFATALLAGDNFAASSYHYNAYYVFANAWWLLIPGLISINCWRKICAAVQSRNKIAAAQNEKKNGKAKAG